MYADTHVSTFIYNKCIVFLNSLELKMLCWTYYDIKFLITELFQPVVFYFYHFQENRAKRVYIITCSVDYSFITVPRRPWQPGKCSLLSTVCPTPHSLGIRNCPLWTLSTFALFWLKMTTSLKPFSLTV